MLLFYASLGLTLIKYNYKKKNEKGEAPPPPPPQKKEMETGQPVCMSTCQSNTYRKDSSWLYFNNEPRVQEKH